jgi:predicted nucleotidyltransferase
MTQNLQESLQGSLEPPALFAAVRRVLADTPYADVVESVILYGSRARGTATADSDYDLLLVLKRECDGRERRDICYAIYDLTTEFDIAIDVRLISVPELDTIKGRQPFIINALTEGIEG